MTAREQQRFLEGIGRDAGAYYNMLGSVRGRDSDCSRPEDRASIHQGVAESIGFGALDRTCFGLLESWMERLLETQVKQSLSIDNK